MYKYFKIYTYSHRSYYTTIIAKMMYENLKNGKCIKNILNYTFVSVNNV